MNKNTGKELLISLTYEKLIQTKRYYIFTMPASSPDPDLPPPGERGNEQAKFFK